MCIKNLFNERRTRAWHANNKDMFFLTWIGTVTFLKLIIAEAIDDFVDVLRKLLSLKRGGVERLSFCSVLEGGIKLLHGIVDLSPLQQQPSFNFASVLIDSEIDVTNRPIENTNASL